MVTRIDRSVSATPTTQTTEPAAPQPPAAAAVPLARASQRNLDNLSGASNGSFAALPAVSRQKTSPLERMQATQAAATARAEAAGRVETASREYRSAREEVNRLNAHLERALRDEPSLRDPAAAERYRAAFETEHRDAFERERTTARALADSIRAAEPLLRTPPNDALGMLDAPGLRDRMTVARGLDTLAQSSEFAQAATLAGQLRTGENPPLPPAVADGIADRAAITSVRADLAHGRSITDAITRASTLVGAAGFTSRIPALSSLGNALAVGENVSEFVRTGDPARIGAAGFAALGAGAAGYAAIVGGGPYTIGAAVVAFAGKAIFEQIANRNDYRRDTDPVFQRAFGVSREAVDRLYREVQDQAYGELRALPESPPPRDELGRIDVTWGQRWMERRANELMAERMAALRPS